MPINYPTSLDALTNPAGSDLLTSPPHSTQHANANDAIEALEAKVGIGADTPAAGEFFTAIATGTTAWTNTLTQPSAAAVAFIIQGAASQTGDAFQVKQSSSLVMYRIRAPLSESGLVHLVQTFTNAPTAGYFSGFRAQFVSKGTSSVSRRTTAFHANVTDDTSVANVTITGAANNGSGLIRITTSGVHSLTTGDSVAIYGVLGTTEANAWWIATVIDTTHFDLVGSTFTNAYVSGGTVTNRPMLSGLVIELGTRVSRGGLTGTAANGDDVAGVTVQITGTGKGTDAYYIAASTSVVGSGWATGFNVDSDADYGYYIGARTVGVGLDMRLATLTTAAIRIPNNASVAALKAAGTTQNLFKLNTSDLLEFAASIQGIPFPATQVPSADANTQDDYEEGTWSPVFTISTPGDAVITHAIQQGEYLKVGNHVFCSFYLTTSTFTWTTASGEIRITLPFTPNSLTSGVSAGGTVLARYTKANYTQIISAPVNSAASTRLVAIGSGQARFILTAAEFPSGTQLDITGVVAFRV